MAVGLPLSLDDAWEGLEVQEELLHLHAHLGEDEVN